MDPHNPSPTSSLEIAHILFMDIVAYSQLPMDHQQRALHELQELVRSTREFVPRNQKIASFGCQREMEWRWFSLSIRKLLLAVRWS